MDGFDSNAAAQVWNRVQGTAPQDAEALPGLLLQVHLTNGLIRSLARVSAGRRKELLGRMLENGTEQERVLQGLHRLRFGEAMELPPAGKLEGTLEAAFRRCSMELLRRNKQYSKMLLDPFYGTSYTFLLLKNCECVHFSLQLQEL